MPCERVKIVRLVIVFSKIEERTGGADLDSLDVRLPMALEVLQLQPLRPIPFMQVHQHSLLQLRLAVCDSNRVVVSVQAVNERLDRGLVDVSNVRRRLSGLLAHDDCVGIDEAESIDDDFALDGLDRINDDGYGTRLERLEGLQDTI